MHIFFFKRWRVLVVFLILSGNLVAQTGSIDSLEALLETKQADKDRVFTLNELSYAISETNPERALKLAEEGAEISHRIQYLEGLKKSYGQIGTAYMNLDNPAKAIEADIKCAEYCEKLNDKEGESSVYHNIGIIYRQLGRLKDAEKYVKKSLDIDIKLGDPFNIGITSNTLGAVFLDMKDTASAYRYFEMSYESFIKAESPQNSAPAVYNMGKILKARGQYEKALPLLRLSAEYYQRNENKVKMAKSMRTIAEIYFYQGKINDAISYYEKSLEIDDLFEKSDIESRNLFSGMANAYEKQNEFKKAYYAIKKAYSLMDYYYDMSDSLRKVNVDSAFAEMATKYETEKKERENQIQKLQLEKADEESRFQKTIIGFSIVGFLLVSGLLAVVFRSQQKTKAANIQINKQKTQIEKQRDEITVKNKEITSSIEYAKTLQDAILPDERYISKFLPQHFILWLPRDIVSGDFYWFYERDGLVFFAVADCTGHGVPGAFVSMTCHNVLNQVVIDQKIDEPGEILSRVHRIVGNVFHREGALATANDGMDCVVCCFSTEKGILQYAGAMNPFVHVHKGVSVELKTDRMAIGGRTPLGYQFSNHSLQLEKGDWFYMYSDGYQDQFGGENGKKFMSAAFKKLLGEVSSLDPGMQRKKLNDRLLKWQGSYDRVDDILVVGFTIV
ncbi:MAG: tetratricopeptide repeat protein [Bacteroidota bacterium]